MHEEPLIRLLPHLLSCTEKPCKKVGEAVIGLEVPHAHIHLIPIQKESDMIFSNPKLKLTNEEFVEVATAINQAWEGGDK